MAIVTHSTNTNVSTPVNCGLPDSVLQGISNRYIVQINAFRANRDPNKPYLTINAYLQNTFTIDAVSAWEAIPQGFGDKTGVSDDIAQIATTLLSKATGGHASPRSLVTASSSRRKWTGSSPMKMSMVLKFEAINNITTEVLLPCMRLQQLALPREGHLGGFFLIPPGPNPFDIILGNSGIGQGDHISLNIGGGFLNFNSIVIDSASVAYENRMGTQGPIGATVTLTIQTYELLTQEKLSRAYGFKAQSSYDQKHSVTLGTPAPGSSPGAGAKTGYY